MEHYFIILASSPDRTVLMPDVRKGVAGGDIQGGVRISIFHNGKGGKGENCGWALNRGVQNRCSGENAATVCEGGHVHANLRFPRAGWTTIPDRT
jgi:hypothetical protein